MHDIVVFMWNNNIMLNVYITIITHAGGITLNELLYIPCMIVVCVPFMLNEFYTLPCMWFYVLLCQTSSKHAVLLCFTAVGGNFQ